MLSRYSKYAALCLAVFFSGSAIAEGDSARGKILADTCEGCHAVPGYNNVYPTYHVPRIAGQSAEYLVSALQLYRDGDREHPTMVAQAASMSDQDIDDIAAYIASVAEPVTGDEVSGVAPAKTSTCAACHGSAGRSALPTNPSLAGQHADYLRLALVQYQQGVRKGPNAAVMQAQLLQVNDADLDEIAAFYARQSGLVSLPKD